MPHPKYDRDNPPPMVAHADHGDPECCGLFLPEERGDVADLACNECGAVLCTVPAAEADATLLRMSMDEGVCLETCPACGEVNVFHGFSAMEAFTCRHCGKRVQVTRRAQ
jgi:hypothetical protein